MRPTPALSEDRLIDIAKKTLLIAPNSFQAIPRGYLDELRQHVRFEKDNTFFHLYPHQGYGYGAVTCLERGCEDVIITLGRNSSLHDGGMSEGIGSLSAHSVHIIARHTHQKERYEFGAAEAKFQVVSHFTDGILNTKPESASSQPPTFNALEKPASQGFNLFSLGISGSSSPSATSSSILPRKRSPTHDVDVPMKRAKFEFLPEPLTQLNNGVVLPRSSSFDTSKAMTPQAARVLLELTNNTIIRNTTLLSEIQRKSKKAAYDRAWRSKLEKQLVDDIMATAHYKRLLESPGSAAAICSPTVKQEYVPNNFFPMVAPSAASGTFPSTPAVMPRELFVPNYGDTAEDKGINSYMSTDDVDKFIQEAGNAEYFDGNASVDKALEKLSLAKLGEQLPLMTVPLMPHQVIGVAWMLEQEGRSNCGGILADEMGLGKTVQMIATILKHRSDDPAHKSTLICAPLAILDQWKLEIEMKTNALTCFIHHGSKKAKNVNELKKYDVVLTTYTTLSLEWPDDDEVMKKQKKSRKSRKDDDFIEDDEESSKKPRKVAHGNLLKMKWWRFVLDEAQNIRNRRTRVSNAVTSVQATHRWCLTGTPVTNTLADCFAFFRFLTIRPWYEWKPYNKHIVILEKKRPDVASARLQALLNTCLLRRKKDSLLDGKKLIELPPKEIELHSLIFSPEEREVYDAVKSTLAAWDVGLHAVQMEKKSQIIFNKYLRAGAVLKNYSYVLLLLLRLRQLCSHPCLIQEGNAFIRPEDDDMKPERHAELQRAVSLAGQAYVDETKQRLKDIERMAKERESKHAAAKEDECSICFDAMDNAILTRCGHSFCMECIENRFQQLMVGDVGERKYTSTERPCPICREPVSKEMIFQRSTFEPTNAELQLYGIDDADDNNVSQQHNQSRGAGTDSEADCPAPRSKRKYKRFSKCLTESDEEYNCDDDSSDLIVESNDDENEKGVRRVLKSKLARSKHIILDSDEEGNSDDDAELLPSKLVKKKRGKEHERFPPSTKMKEMMRLLKGWAEAEETKNEKTMVLSQWTSCMDLFADYLEENGFTFVRYQGNMSRQARDEAVRIFMSQGKARIMLMSLKCGGVGLNLTRANRVISADLGWSPAVEHQAFDRVHRLGQTRKVSIHRLVIENTVETRILALQERKQNLANGSLGEGTGKKLGRLSVKDLAALFGLSVRGGF